MARHGVQVLPDSPHAEALGTWQVPEASQQPAQLFGPHPP